MSKTTPVVRPAWCEIDLGAIPYNIAQMRQLTRPDVSIFICLKCDAFGCGAVEVGKAIQDAGAAGLAFGNVDIAIACRKAGVNLPILLYPSCLPTSAALLQKYELMPTISTLDDIVQWDGAATGGLRVFMKVECGGLRVGAFPSQVVAIARAIRHSRHLSLAGVYGHMLAYGLDDPKYAKAQLDSFTQAMAALDCAGLGVATRMFSSSETFLMDPSADLSAVEPGRLVLGMEFPAVPQRQRGWRKALVGIKSRLVMVKSLAEMNGVLPVPHFALREDMRIGLIPLGWSDGFPRELPKGASVLVGGKRVALLGPVHAELLRVDLTDVPEAQIGDEVVLLGTQGERHVTLDDLITQWDVTELDVYTSIVERLPKTYLND